MRKQILCLCVLCTLCVLSGAAFYAAPSAAQQHQHTVPDGKLGTVRFETSCNAAAQTSFNRAVALLHSFDFGRAIDTFNDALKADGTCAIAEWGIALGQWTNPFATGARPAAQLQLGSEAVARGRSVGAKTEREKAYIDAVANLYADSEKTPQATRVAAYRDAMANLAARYPADTEATVFYALALAFAADPADKTYADQLKAGAMMEKLFAKQPDHPGLAHYIIHGYDVPPLADRAIEAARRYSRIAPAAPHALHMPSHTFTRVGYWQESIDANIAAAAAAKRDGLTAEELHAADYQTYAYLQIGQDRAARRLVDSLAEIATRFDPRRLTAGAAPPSAGFFALAAIPARYAVERGAWSDAAKLEAKETAFPYTEAMVYFARAIGAARSGDAATARAAVDALSRCRDRLAAAGERYWQEQVEIQRRGALAWTRYADGAKDEAVAEMRAAAEREDATEKSAVTPGPLLPARELLGDMLLELNQPAEARKQFEATLRKEPNRFRALAGAAKASLDAGDRRAARNYYEQLLKMSTKADTPGRRELQDARTVVGGASSGQQEPRIDDRLTAAPTESSIVLAGGCFWGIEAVYEHTKGVLSATSGYAGGTAKTAKYEIVSSGTTGHAESVRVVYDASQITAGQLLNIFFTVAHDPTQLNRQGPDEGTQYRSAIFYSNAEQQRIAEAYIAQLGEAKVFRRKIVTEIVALQGFFPAEAYHQEYAEKHPYDPYIMVNDRPKVEHLKKAFPGFYVERRR